MSISLDSVSSKNWTLNFLEQKTEEVKKARFSPEFMTPCRKTAKLLIELLCPPNRKISKCAHVPMFIGNVGSAVACQAPCPWDSLGKNTGVGCHALLQGIFWTQGSNLHLFQIVTHLAKSERCMIRRKGRWNQVTWGMGSCTGRNSVWEKGWANVCKELALLSPSFLPLLTSRHSCLSSCKRKLPQPGSQELTV